MLQRTEQWRLNLMQTYDIIRGGWCQGFSVSPDGGVCIGYAMRQTAGASNDAYREQIDHVVSFLRLHVDPKEGSEITLVRWNNAPGRTKEEVLAALEGAAS